MAQFSYKARTLEGKVQSGVAQAADQEALIHQLRQQGLYCFDVKNKEQGLQGTATPVKIKHLANFCRQLATMLHAGVNMAQALDTIYQSTSQKRMKAAVLELYEGVQKGQPLSVTMGQMGKSFPELLIYMVETGETSGTLDVIMEKMADHFDNELQMKRKITNALIYPCILMIVAVAVVIFMLAVVMPSFINMYQGVDLPAVTKSLLNVSDFVQAYWMILLLGLLALVLGWMFAMTQKPFRTKVKRLLLRLPVIGKLLRTILTSRFASTFSILYSSGVSVLKSIDITSRVLGNDYVEQQLVLASEGLRRGEMLSQCLRDTDVFNDIFLAMVLVGEEAGSLDDILKKTGDYFEKEANAALSKMVALLEPVMIVVLGLVIGYIVIAMLLPIFNMYNQML